MIWNLMIQSYFEVCVSPINTGEKLQHFEDSSLVILGYQLLPLAIDMIVGDNNIQKINGW